MTADLTNTVTLDLTDPHVGELLSFFYENTHGDKGEAMLAALRRYQQEEHLC